MRLATHSSVGAMVSVRDQGNALPDRSVSEAIVLCLLRPFHVLLVAPSLLYLFAMAVMLFRPPDVQFYSLDRVALLVVLAAVVLRTLSLKQRIWIPKPVTGPLAGLVLIAFCSVCSEPYSAENWSLFASKWVVPLLLHFLAGLVFTHDASIRQFEIFSLAVLAYLCLIAVFFLIDVRWLIYPQYILNENIGIHFDRARGPFLQAVANGVSLNILGLVAIDSFRRCKLRTSLAISFMLALPLAILATKTRAVWATFASSVFLLPFLASNTRLRRACFAVIIFCALGTVGYLLLGNISTSLGDRLQETSPVEFRVGMYVAGWQMFLAKPLGGWEANTIQPELGRRISDFHPPFFLFHNTYLEIAVKHGLIGLSLYAWMIIDLFRLGRRSQCFKAPPNGNFLDAGFRRLWPLLLMVYLVNATFVVMSYQFVNAILFTIAGMLASQNYQARQAMHFEIS